MLVITGTQRSGTSIMARFFIEAGYSFDNNVDWDEEIAGGYDNVHIDRFFREYIGDPNFSYSDIMTKTGKEVIEPSIYPKGAVCKIAYLMQNPIFIYIWHKFRGNKDRFIIMDRDKEFVFRTKQRRWDRFQFDSILLQQSPVEMDFMFNKSLRVMEDLGFQFVLCPMPEVFLSWDTFHSTVGQVAFIDGKKEVFDKLIDPTKIHYLEEMMEKKKG